jgi:NAD-dependent deacetylase
MARELAASLAAAGDGAGALLAVTGAGVSAASGLPTFRGADPDAVWRRDDVEIATLDYFRRDPAGQWRWFLDRFAGVGAARPNPAHRALAALERWQTARGGSFLVVTQNVDLLHERAGSRRLVKVHGSADRLRCSRHGCPLGAPAGSLPREEVDLGPFLAAPVAENLPTCPRCGALLRPHALFFDEYYGEHRDYGFDRVVAAAERADLALFAGTSLSVGVTDLVLRAALGRRVAVFAVDPAAPRLPAGVRVLPAPAEALLPAVCRRLGAPLDGGGEAT